MEVLVDTGVLLRVFDRSSADQKVIFRDFRLLWKQGHSLVTSHQNIAEFWNVATRPTNRTWRIRIGSSRSRKACPHD